MQGGTEQGGPAGAGSGRAGQLLLVGGALGVVLLIMCLLVDVVWFPGRNLTTQDIPRVPGLPSIPTAFPSGFPTGFPTGLPSGFPTGFPTDFPTGFPTDFPTGFPTDFPSGFPTSLPTGFRGGVPAPSPVAAP